MMKLKFKRLGSLFMACALMVAGMGDGVLSLPVEAAVGDVKLEEFETGNTTVTCVAPTSINVKTVPENSGSLAKLPAIITKDSVDTPESEMRMTNDTGRLVIEVGENAAGDYRVVLDLKTDKNEGTVIETIPKDPADPNSDSVDVEGTFKINFNEAVDSTSTIAFVCIGNNAGIPSFKVEGLTVGGSGGSGPSGVFAPITNVVTNNFNKTTGEIKVGLRNGEYQTYSATFNVKQKLDATTGDMRVGTRFHFSFAREQTAPMTIRVLDPQQMVDNMADTAKDPGQKDNTYRLQEGIDTSLTAIRGNSFWLVRKNKAPQGVDVDARWYFTPYEDMGTLPFEKKKDVLPALIDPDKPGGYNTNYDGLDDKQMKEVGITKQTEAVQGYLYPVFSYTFPGGKTYSSNIDRNGVTKYDVNNLPRLKSGNTPSNKLEITILGLGDTARASTDDQWVNKSKESEIGIPFNNNEVPMNIPMDFYDGSKNKEKVGTEPYQFSGKMFSGTQSLMCDRVVVTSSNPDAVTFIQYDEGGNPKAYTFGQDIKFPANITGEKSIRYMVQANKPGDEGGAQTDLKFSFYNKDVPTPLAVNETHISVKDTSPNNDTKLENLKMYAYKGTSVINTFINVFRDGGGGELYEAFRFKPDQFKYPEKSAARKHLELRNTVEEINFQPYCGNYNQKIKIEVFDNKDNIMPQYTQDPIASQAYTMKVPLTVGQPVKIVFTVTAEDGATTGTYEINVVRKPPSEDATLENLQAFESAAVDAAELPLTPKFDAKNLTYQITNVPYNLKEILIKATPADEGAVVTSIKTDIPEDTGTVDSKTNSRLVPLRYDISQEGVINNKTTVTVEITAENGTVKTYTIVVSKVAPNTDATLGKLEVTDGEDKALPYTPSLSGTVMEYQLKIPYTTKEVKFRATAKVPESNVALMQGTKMLIPKMSTDIFTKAYPVDPTSEAAPSYDFNFAVTAEDGVTLKTYTLKIIREAPNNDAALSAIGLADEKGGALAVEGFDPEKKTYDIEVPYSVEAVVVTPTPKNPKSTVRVDGKAADKEGKFPKIKLAYPGTTTIDIVVTAEDGVTTDTYTLNIKRSKPGSDARLKSLVAAKIVDDKLKPLFVPDVLKYTATMVADEKGVTITATANDPKAKITIDGKPAESGKPFGPIELVAVQQTVEIVITAEDGKTSTTYTITFTNDNLVVKSPNADLKSLKVQKGEMRPAFKSSTTNYEMYVTENTFDVDLFPVPADSLAKMEVFAGTLKIGDYGGNYSQSIVDGENPFSIKVTSPDGKVTKDYLVNVYRNEEDKMGSLKPLTVDDVNFEESGDIISVDVTKWPRVQSEVFSELKNYPEKKMVFQGNDYSLQFDSKDLNTIIPATQIYDFGMDFTSDLEDAIMTEIAAYSGNSDARPVLVDFNYHGELPGKATFTLSLGKQYANKKLYFHYYNEERGRIDYYGYVQTNSKGTFSVSLDRLGTFIITDDKRLIGSENKAFLDTQAEGVDLGKTEDVIKNKVNPNTGVTYVAPPVG